MLLLLYSTRVSGKSGNGNLKEYLYEREQRQGFWETKREEERRGTDQSRSVVDHICGLLYILLKYSSWCIVRLIFLYYIYRYSNSMLVELSGCGMVMCLLKSEICSFFYFKIKDHWPLA